jgi:glycosyltransferase involved in cell wall biosynthesis
VEMTELISIILPMKNEGKSVERLFARISGITLPEGIKTELIVVNDGSTDNTLGEVLKWQEKLPSITVIDLVRSFGKEAAVTAGLANASGVAVVIMDADLQHPPEVIPLLIERWRTGAEVVIVSRSDRGYESAGRRIVARLFYYIVNRISDIELPEQAGDFRLLDRRVVDAFLSLPERNRFNKGIFAWLGFRAEEVISTFSPRERGGGWQIRSLAKLALDGITSFSSLPLRVWSVFGFMTAFAALAYGAFLLGNFLSYGSKVPGFASLVLLILFFGGMNMVALGVLGEYIARIFVETKGRPLYIVRKLYRQKTEQLSANSDT